MNTLHILIALLVILHVNADDQSTNQMNGPGNVVYSGTGNVANGRDNTFNGNDNVANGNLNNFNGNTNQATGLAN
jgi:hypothetical protein